MIEGKISSLTRSGEVIALVCKVANYAENGEKIPQWSHPPTLRPEANRLSQRVPRS